jgi:OOP family OmpA-OmpF porin
LAEQIITSANIEVGVIDRASAQMQTISNSFNTFNKSLSVVDKSLAITGAAIGTVGFMITKFGRSAFQEAARVEELETMLNDTDQDGVPDHLDVENNTIGGVVVDTKGRAVDLNNNGVPDELESYINNTYGDLKATVNNLVAGDNNYSNAQMRSMINGQYVNVFFDFDETRITTGTISAINFLIKYMNANPNTNAEVIGYADEFGNFDYNVDLSRRRAQRVMEMIVRSGIDAKRLKLVVKGEDASVPKDSKLARQLVRRVAFKVD